MAVNLGELARKLLVNPIVAVGKAVGSDYKSTVYGADWRERAIMRRRMAEARLAESAARTASDIEQTGYNREYKRALSAKLTEETETKGLQRRGLVEAARQAGMDPEAYIAKRETDKQTIKAAVDAARIELLNAQTDTQRTLAQNKLAWLEAGGPESVVARNFGAAAASEHSADRPFAPPGGRLRLPNDKYMMLDLALQSGDVKELSKQLRTVSREQLVGSVGESHPLVEAYDKLKAAPAPAPK